MQLIDARNLHLVDVPLVYGTQVVLMTAWGGLEAHLGSNGYWQTLDGSLTQLKTDMQRQAERARWLARARGEGYDEVWGEY